MIGAFGDSGMDKIEELKKMLPSIQNSVSGLRKESVTSLCGPCPKCGGDDRFVYRTDSERFFCRQCNEKGGDVIDFYAWVEGTDTKGLIKKYLPDSKPKANTYQKTKPFEHFELGFPVKKYAYVDENDQVKYYNCRFIKPDGDKTFRQCDPTGLNWSTKHIKPKVPYNLPKVIKAESAVIVEGEKDVHNLAKIGIVGTCNVAGAGNWTPDLNKHLKGKEVYLMSDKDPAGRKHVQKVYENLKGIAASIKEIKLPDSLPNGGDFSDWLQIYFSNNCKSAAERFAIMVEGAEPYTPPITEGSPSNKIVSSEIELITLDTISNIEIEDNPVIDDLLGEKESLIMSAASGTGKSLASDQIALTCGNPPENGLWGMFNIPKPVKTLIVQSENSIGAVNRRLRKLFAVNSAMKKGAKNVFMMKVNDDIRLSGCVTDLSFQSLLIEKLTKLDAKLLILDPLVSFHDMDENDNAGMRTVLDCVTSICDQTGASVIICHHFNRQDLTRGAAAIRDWAANFLLLNFERKVEGSTILRCVHDKSRNYETVPDFYLERTSDLQFLRCEKPGEKSEQIDAVITALTTMGGQVDSQAHLKNAIQVELNCGEKKARGLINQALEMRKIIVVPGTGKGNPSGYRMP